MKKRIFIIIISVLAALIAATAVVFLIINALKLNNNTDLSSSGSAFETGVITDVSNSEETVSSENTETDNSSTVENTDNGITLKVTSPSKTSITITEPNVTFSGESDPLEPLTFGGNEVARDADGRFSFNVNLNIGKNYFKFEHKGQTYNYTVNYRFVVIDGFSPWQNESFENGSVMPVNVSARKGSTVTAEFCGEKITLNQTEAETGGDFTNFSGSFNLPSGSLKDVSLGKIVFTATYNGITESFSSGNIVCKKPSNILSSNPAVTPSGARYIDVGSGKITEIIAYEAETYDAYSTNDWSKPTNNYLPKGTVDYSSSEYIYSTGEERKEYALLRCGKQVYTKRRDVPRGEVAVVKEYAGTLPDHNEVRIATFENGTTHSKLTLNVMWKAPFYFELLGQSYNNVAVRDYGFSKATYSHIDITLCYATVLTGELAIPEDNPIFKSAEIIKNESDYTLRLHLKRQGKFFGWLASYNESGQLVFEFLNPAKIISAENEYGANLNGAHILIDVGHGGKDPGAAGADATHSEAAQNLILAYKLKAELESIGARVTLTRETDATSSTDDKITLFKALKPDYCIAIHHNASGTNRNKDGFSSHFFHPFSKEASDMVYLKTAEAGLYKNTDVYWHRYFMGRATYSPVVLTENGYMSNSYDYANIVNEEYNVAKAKALTRGIIDYFWSIQ